MIVNVKCDLVHFSNRATEKALTVEVKENDGIKVVTVPNIILQTAGEFKVYAYICDKDECYTLVEKVFYVESKPKPEDYVYTETDVLTYQKLEERIKVLEDGGASPDAINKAVKEYLDENPVEVELPETLPNPHKLLFTGAVQAEYDGSQPITVEIPEGGSGGGSADLTGYATEQYVDDAIENAKEIYVGDGEPPENVVFQIDPEGDVVVFEPVKATEGMTQPVGLDANGKLWTTPGGGSSEYRLVDAFDLSSGALSYTADTTGCKDILVVNTAAVTCSGATSTWKGVTVNSTITKAVGTVANYVALPDNMILAIVTRDTSEPLANHKVYFDAVEINNEFTIICASASAGIIKVYGR